MSEPLAITVLLALDVAATAVTFFATLKLGRNFVGGAIGGVLLELARIGVAMAVTNAAQPWSPTDFTVWLVNFRLFNIPILVGIGFLGGSAASSSGVGPTSGNSEAPIQPPASGQESTQGQDEESVELLSDEDTTADTQEAVGAPLSFPAKRFSMVSSTEASWTFLLDGDMLFVDDPEGHRRHSISRVSASQIVKFGGELLYSSNIHIKDGRSNNRFSLAAEDLTRVKSWINSQSSTSP